MKHKRLWQVLLVALIVVILLFGFWFIRHDQSKAYAQGAIDEYAKVQKLPRKVIKKLSVAYDYKTNGWVALVTIHLHGKPYQLEYWVSRADTQPRRPEVLFSVYHKEGEGWGEINDRLAKKFKYRALYDYQ